MGKGGCSFGSFFLRQENEHNLLLLFEKKRIFHLPSAISHLFEHPPSPSPLKGLHLSLVFSPLMGKKTAPPVALTLR